MLRQRSRGLRGMTFRRTVFSAISIVGTVNIACLAASDTQDAEPAEAQETSPAASDANPVVAQPQPFDPAQVDRALMRELTDEWLKMKRKRVISESQRKSGARISDPNSEVEISFRRLDDLERRLQTLGASSRQIREIYRSIDERENRRRSTELLLRKAIVALERDSYTLGRLERGLSETSNTDNQVNEARRFVEQDQRMLDELEDELHGLGASWAEIEIINAENALQEKTLIRQLGASDKLREQRWQAAHKVTYAIRDQLAQQEALPPQRVDEELQRTLQHQLQTETRDLDRLGRMLRALGMTVEDQERIEAVLGLPAAGPARAIVAPPAAAGAANQDGRSAPHGRSAGPLNRRAGARRRETLNQMVDDRST